MPNQLELLDQQYCQGLVGQLPYEMGKLAIDTLYELVTSDQEGSRPMPKEFIGTNVLEHIFVPLTLPELIHDENLIGELRYIGYILFGMVAVMSIGFSVWVYLNRTVRVVRVAQPRFLILVAFGVMVLCATILPLGYDDSTAEHYVAICMGPMWFLTLGFSITFSSLFAKIYRVHVLFQRGINFSRIRMSEKDVLVPLFLVLAINISILTAWTVLNPLRYQRLDHAGTDGWNRPISSFGTCHSDESPLPFVIPLGLVNGLMLVFANWSAYRARKINVEFSESRYIAWAMASMLQAALSGIPLLFVVKESPQAFYLVLVFNIFIMSTVILLLIFVPKMVLYRALHKEPSQNQAQMLHQSIWESQRRASSSVRKKDLRDTSVKQIRDLQREWEENSSSCFESPTAAPPGTVKQRKRYTTNESDGGVRLEDVEEENSDDETMEPGSRRLVVMPAFSSSKGSSSANASESKDEYNPEQSRLSVSGPDTCGDTSSDMDAADHC